MALGIFARRLAMAVTLAAAFAGPTVAHAVVSTLGSTITAMRAFRPGLPDTPSWCRRSGNRAATVRTTLDRGGRHSPRGTSRGTSTTTPTSRETWATTSGTTSRTTTTMGRSTTWSGVQLPHDPRVDVMVGARLRGGHRHQLCAQSARSILLERQGRTSPAFWAARIRRVGTARPTHTAAKPPAKNSTSQPRE